MLKLPSIFKNWNKQSDWIQLTPEQLNDLNNNKTLTINIKIPFPNKHNNYLINDFHINLSITACTHDNLNALVPTADDGGDMQEAPEGVDTHFECEICGYTIFM